MTVSREGVEALHDHQIAQARALAEMETWCWYATDILLEADAIFRAYGPPPAPGDEVAGLLASVRDYLLTVPHVDTDMHNHPMPERPPALPETPTGGVSGKEAPLVGPGIDIHADDDISRAFDDLKLTDDIDGDRP